MMEKDQVHIARSQSMFDPIPPSLSPRFGHVREVAGDVSMVLALLANQIRTAFPSRIEALIDLSGVYSNDGDGTD